MERSASRSEARRAKVADVGGLKLKGGLVQVTITLDPHDLEVVRAEAKRRARAREDARTDWSASELIRLAIRAWIAKNIPRP